MSEALQQPNILLEASEFTVAAGSNWTSDAVSSAGVGEVVVSVATDNTPNYAVYVVQTTSYPSASGVVPVEVTTVDFPPGYSTFYVARAVVRLDADRFQVQVFNTDESVTALFGVSVRILSRSA